MGPLPVLGFDFHTKILLTEEAPMIELNSAIEGITAAFNILKAAIRAHDEKKVTDAMAAMHDRISELSISRLEVAEKNVSLHGRLAELEREVAEFKGKTQERERYTLSEIAKGKFAYKFTQQTTDHATPHHYLCQLCWDGDIKSVLQLSEDGTFFSCRCRKEHGIRIAPGVPLRLA